MLALTFITGCVGTNYTPELIKSTPNTIPEKTEVIGNEANRIDTTADSIERRQPALKEEVTNIKKSTNVIRQNSDSIKTESIVHDTEKQKTTEQLQEVTVVVKQLQDSERGRKLNEARNIKYGVIGIFALSAIGFIWYGFSIPGTGYTMLGSAMAVITMSTAIIWSYLEQYPLIVTAVSVIIGIGAVMMHLCKKKKKSNPLGFE